MGKIFAFLNNIMLFASESTSEMSTGQRILLILGIIVGVCIAVVVLSLLVILIRAMIQAGINLRKQNANGQQDDTDFVNFQNASNDCNLRDTYTENKQTNDKNDGNVDK